MARDPQLLVGVPQLLGVAFLAHPHTYESIPTTLALFDHVGLFLQAVDLTLIIYAIVNSTKN